jgi:hypothetical protein
MHVVVGCSHSGTDTRLLTMFATLLEGAAAPIAMHMTADVMLAPTRMPINHRMQAAQLQGRKVDMRDGYKRAVLISLT